MASTLGFEPGPHWWEASALDRYSATSRNFNRGQNSWDTFALLGHFPIHTGLTSPLAPQTTLDAYIQNFF